MAREEMKHRERLMRVRKVTQALKARLDWHTGLVEFGKKEAWRKWKAGK